MTNQAINWVKAQQSMTPDKPFFVYYATGATHAPHHVPKEWADKYKGQFDKGWDQVRAETLERQKKLGVDPGRARSWPSGRRTSRRGTRCRPISGACSRARPKCSRDSWSRPTREIGRFAKALEDIGEMDNTLFIYIAGDNGTSAEGGFVGMYNEMTYFNGVDREGRGSHPVDRQVGRSGNLPAHGGRLGGGVRYAVLVDQAGGVRLRRHPQRHGHPLAARASRRRAACAASSRTSSTSRRRSSRPPACRSPRASTARCRRRSRARAWSTPSTMRRRRSGTRRSTSRCSAIARSTATAGWRAPSTARRGRRAACSR